MDSANYHDQLLSGIANFTAAIANIRLYSKDHPQIQRYIDKAYTAIESTLKQLQTLTVILIGEEVVINNAPLKTKAPHLSQFRRLLKESGIERLSFMPDLTRKDFQNFIFDLATPQNKAIHGQNTIRIGKLGLKEESRGSSYPLSGKVTTPLQTPEQLELIERLKQIPLENLQEIYAGIKKEKTINVNGLEGIVNSFINAFSHGLRPLEMLANLKASDQYTFTHVVNVCLLTMAQAEMLGISGNKLYDVGVAAVLHDVGKLFVPDSILNKPGKLTQEERVIIENHALSGAQYILKLNNVPQMAILGALEHHIRYDGSGYPFISANWRPHLISQIIAISDIYDAMSSQRPYQNPKPEELILNILKKEKGTSFNPHLVDNFLKLIHQKHSFTQNQGADSHNHYRLDQTHIPQTSGS